MRMHTQMHVVHICIMYGSYRHIHVHVHVHVCNMNISPAATLWQLTPTYFQFTFNEAIGATYM